ncbi:MAG: 30S ribosomal protein S4 [Candidatus Omnitrophica bacterium]|nr:30S ribosomal protein S4 [Candidatus Omnitrophota bacterium]
MVQLRGGVCKLCRRAGVKLFLKGRRCMTEKCSVEKRAYPPGQHGKRRPRHSDYGIRLKEKQKVRRIYGVSEKQMKKYYQSAAKTKGVTGEIMLQLLERRLDNVVFRSNFALSRSQARGVVSHGHIYVNGRRVNIPSYLVKPEDVITVKNREASKNMLKENIKLSEDKPIPGWIEVLDGKTESRILGLPERKDIAIPIQEQFIVEFYSR